MPIVDISGLTPEEKDAKKEIRIELKKYFHAKFDFPEESTTVTFISDDTIELDEYVMVRLYSKKFTEMNVPGLEDMCDEIVSILEKFAGHSFNGIIILSTVVIHGRKRKEQKGAFQDDGHNFFCGVERGPRN